MDTPPPLQPSPTSELTRWKVILHLTGLLGLMWPLGGNLIGPLVVWLIKKGDLPEIDLEGRKVLNFQISYLIYLFIASTVAFALAFLLLPLLLPGVVALAWLIFTILGAIKASNGEEYRFPMTFKIF